MELASGVAGYVGQSSLSIPRGCLLTLVERQTGMSGARHTSLTLQPDPQASVGRVIDSVVLVAPRQLHPSFGLVSAWSLPLSCWRPARAAVPRSYVGVPQLGQGAPWYSGYLAGLLHRGVAPVGKGAGV